MPGLEARLAEQRGLLVAGDAAHRDREPGGARRARSMPKRPLLGRTSGRHARGTPNRSHSSSDHVERVDVEEQRAARVRRVGRVHAAVGAAGEPPQDPRVDRAEREVGVGGRRRPRCSSHSSLVAEKYGSSTRPVRARTSGSWPGVAQLVAARRGAAVLPDDRAVQRPRRCARSHTTTVSRWLVMPIAATVSPSPRARGRDLGERRERRVPDVVGVVLDPARLREVLRELAVRRRARAGRRSSTASVRTPVVPASIARTTAISAAAVAGAAPARRRRPGRRRVARLAGRRSRPRRRAASSTTVARGRNSSTSRTPVAAADPQLEHRRARVGRLERRPGDERVARGRRSAASAGARTRCGRRQQHEAPVGEHDES